MSAPRALLDGVLTRAPVAFLARGLAVLLAPAVLAMPTALRAEPGAKGVELSDGDAITFAIPAASGNGAALADEISFFVPRGVRNARVTFSGDGGGRDVDLFLRADEPFPDTSGSNGNSLFDRLTRDADFWSISAFDEEYVNLQDFATPAVQGRTWHVAVLAYAGVESSGALGLEFERTPPPANSFEVDFTNATGAGECDTSLWNGGGGYTPEGGNNASTVGEARRNAMLEAARLLAGELSSRIPVKIRACWGDLGERDDDGSITLAGARSNNFPFSTPGLPPATVYSQAAATRLAGTDICRVQGGSACEDQEVIITFNSQAADSYYYGFEPATRSTVGRDFITVAMHEITHGLGFFDIIGEDGAPPTVGGAPIFGAYDRRLAFIDGDGRTLAIDDPSVSNAERAAAFTSFTDLLWLDDQASVQEANTLLTFETGLIRMNAPPAFQPGSSVGHVSSAYCSLMRPSLALCSSEAIRELGLARKILDAVGWADARQEPLATGLYLDRTRPGHGYDLRFGGVGADGEPIYVLTFYSYRALGGTPEWFQAVGTVRDGAFVGIRNDNGHGLPRFIFDAGSEPPQTADPDSFGQVAVSLNNVSGSPACTDGVNRRDAERLASFQWAIERDAGEWCAEPLVADASLPPSELDYGGLWFAGLEDQGWGFTIETIAQGNGDLGLFVLAYVYDADGSPVWFFATAERFEPGVAITLPLFQRTGYTRRITDGNLSDAEAGELTLTLVTPSNDIAAGNRASINVNFIGGAGGSWVRDDVPIQRLTAPR